MRDKVTQLADAVALAEARKRKRGNMIECTGGSLTENVYSLEKILGAEKLVYQRDLQLVRIASAATVGLAGEGSRDGIVREEAQLVVTEATAEWLRVALGEKVEFVKTKRDGNGERQHVPTDCPKDYASCLLSLGIWPSVPRLTGIATSPMIRRDGSVIQTQGYDEPSGLYLALDGAWPPVPQSPGRDDAVRALERLLEPFDEFQFDDGGLSRSALGALIITRVVRPLTRTAPLFYVTAPAAGSGKTLLADAVNVIACGLEIPKRAWPRNEEEQRKTITASCLSGDAAIAFDNVPRGMRLASPALDAAITSGTWQDRRLGASEIVTLPFRITIVVTGNNVGPAADSVRRALRIGLSQDVERPEAREFRIPDLLHHLRRERRRLLVDVLTVLRAHALAGRPADGVTRMGSFEDWREVVAAPLVWLGQCDPIVTQTRLRDEDDEAEEHVGLLHALRAAFGRVQFNAADVCRRAWPEPPASPDISLRDAVQRGRPGELSAAVMGKRLRAFAGTLRGGLRLRCWVYDGTFRFVVEAGDEDRSE